jgi:hypothetical protein
LSFDINCFVNLLGGLIAYCHQPKKPSIVSEQSLSDFTLNSGSLVFAIAGSIDIQCKVLMKHWSVGDLPND